MSNLKQHKLLMWKIKNGIPAMLSFQEHGSKTVVVVTPRYGITKSQLENLQAKIEAGGFEFVLAGEAFS